jgi:hypothetical protein
MWRSRKGPDFIIAGAQKGGTTSLFYYLAQHPQFVSQATKEIHFFDCQFSKGIDWYLNHFVERKAFDKGFTGEASPYYLFHPLVPQRIKNNFAKTKIIILLRNPALRAWSQYLHNRRFIPERTVPFDLAFEKEAQIIAEEEQRLLEDDNAFSLIHQEHSYYSRGLYYQQVKRWLKVFPRRRILILRSEDLYEKPQETYNQVCRFMKIKRHPLSEIKPFNQGTGQRIKAEDYQRLMAYYETDIQKLERLIGKRLDWS